MKGYKTAYTPSEVRTLEKKARREGGPTSPYRRKLSTLAPVWRCWTTVLMLKRLLRLPRPLIAPWSTSFLSMEPSKITNSIRETYGLELNFYGSDTTVFGERGKIK